MATPAFKYQEPFPLGKDTTEYVLLTDQHVSVGNFEGQEILIKRLNQPSPQQVAPQQEAPQRVTAPQGTLQQGAIQQDGHNHDGHNHDGHNH